MRRGPFLLFFAALLLLGAAGAGTPVYAIEPAHPSGATACHDCTAAPGHHTTPRIAALPAAHRSTLVTSGDQRRLKDRDSKLMAPVGTDPELKTREARVDGQPGAPLLNTSSTACCVRGPPTEG